MSDPAVESYKKALAKVVENYGKDIDKLAKQVEQWIKTLHDQVGDMWDDFEVKLARVEIPAEADEKELAKVPDWLVQLITKESAPLKVVTIKPEAEINVKTKKMTGCGASIAYDRAWSD